MQENLEKPIIAEVNLNGEQNSQNLHIHELAPTEAYEIPIDRETKKIESISYGGDTEIEGIKVGSVIIGGDIENAEIDIIDISDAPVIGYATRVHDGKTIEEPRRHFGKRDGEPMIMAGDYIAVIPSKRGGKPHFRSLVAGHKWNIGRDVSLSGSLGLEFPDTVSRDHCAIGMTDNGKVFIENHAPTNFTSFKPTIEKIGEETEATHESLDEDTAVSLISYADVLDSDEAKSAVEYTKNSENGMKYAHQLQKIVAEKGLATVMSLAEKLKDKCLEDLKSLGIKPTKFAESTSWALWEIAKQHYFFEHPDEVSDEYSGQNYVYIANPLEQDHAGKLKQEEIIDRHLGWEANIALDNREFTPHEVVRQEVLDVYFRGQRNQTGQLKSFELARMGRRLARTIYGYADRVYK